MSLAGQIAVDGAKVDLYALSYSAQQTLLVASLGDRVVVLSDPGLLLTSESTPQAGAQAVVRSLLSSNGQHNLPYVGTFQLPAEFGKHSISVRAHYLSFGYQRFFPGLDAVRFDFGDGRWATQALFDGARRSAIANCGPRCPRIPPPARCCRWTGVPGSERSAQDLKSKEGNCRRLHPSSMVRPLCAGMRKDIACAVVRGDLEASQR